MSDPYLVLGVKPSASDEEVKRAYRDLVKQYHPDNYQNNPLADLAEEKMKEINEAYDAIVKQRSGGGGYQGQSRQGRSYSGTTTDPVFGQVRQLLGQYKLDEAQALLERSNMRTAEWYYLMGSVAYRRGWLSEARENLTMACNMEPGNFEYRQAVEQLNSQSGRGFQSYQGRGFSTSDVCSMFLCWSCCCDGCH